MDLKDEIRSIVKSTVREELDNQQRQKEQPHQPMPPPPGFGNMMPPHFRDINLAQQPKFGQPSPPEFVPGYHPYPPVPNLEDHFRKFPPRYHKPPPPKSPMENMAGEVPVHPPPPPHFDGKKSKDDAAGRYKPLNGVIAQTPGGLLRPPPPHPGWSPYGPDGAKMKMPEGSSPMPEGKGPPPPPPGTIDASMIESMIDTDAIQAEVERAIRQIFKDTPENMESRRKEKGNQNTAKSDSSAEQDDLVIRDEL